MKANLPQLLVYRAQSHLNIVAEGLVTTLLVALSVTSSVVAMAPTQHINQQPAEYAQELKVIKARKFKSLPIKSTTSNAPVRNTSKKVSLPNGFALIKACESGGNYRAVNPAGYYGAYQFSTGTWDSTARSAGRNDLVGVRPDKASPNDQDAMAKQLHSLRGWQPWGCAYHVGLL